MTTLQELAKMGKEMGLSGADLVSFINQQQAAAREERAARREEEKRAKEEEDAKKEMEIKQEEMKLRREKEEKDRQERLEKEEKDRQERLEKEEKDRQERIEKEEKDRQERIEREAKKRESEEQERLARVEMEKAKIAADEKIAQEKIISEEKVRLAEVERLTTERSTPRDIPKSPKLPAFRHGVDDLDAYIERFERFATTHKWEKTSWASSLSALLTGKALEVYSRLSVAEASNFDQLKQALLARYELTAEGFRKKLRESVPEEMESPMQYITRLQSYLTRWVELSKTDKTYDGLVEAVLMEQFIASCNVELATFLRERDCKKLTDLAQASENFLHAHGKQMKDYSKKSNSRKEVPRPAVKPYCVLCKRFGHDIRDCRNKNDRDRGKGQRCFYCEQSGHGFATCRKLKEDRQRGTLKVAAAIDKREKSKTEDRVCYICGEGGHIAWGCPKRNQPSQNNREEQGSAALVPRCMEGRDSKAICDCMGKNKVKLACGREIDIAQTGCSAVSREKMPVCQGKVNGMEVEMLRDSGCSCVVVKKALVKADQYTGEQRRMIRIDNSIMRADVAKIEIDTPYYSGIVEALCLDDALYGLIVGNVKGVRAVDDPDMTWGKTENDEAAAVETRQQAKKEKGLRALKVPGAKDEMVNAQVLSKLQKEDSSLQKFWEKKEKKRSGKGEYWFEVKNQLLYRYFQSPEYNHGEVVKQLMVPEKLREQVMNLAHDAMMGGHMAVKRTYERVSTNFYWPGIVGDITRYCRSCDICQRTTPKGKVSKAPLGKIPVIDEPFKRGSCDIIGPINPASERGHRYIFTYVDHALRYPEAICLKSITTEAVAEAMVEIFSRIGVPEEILSDMGTQFMSDVMKEVSRLLSIKQITTTPYHPMCNGLCERFNGTLKTMLKRLCAEQPKQWDRYVNPLLFAYREVPQESTGFAPFELMYGRTIRGPMHILRELWTKEQQEPEVKSSYQYVVDLRDRIETTLEIARQGLEKAHSRSKHYYDKRTRPRKLRVGERVLILLPTDGNKLLMQWKGPYTVKEKLGQNDYRIEVQGKTKTYHINLLKQYMERDEKTAVGVISNREEEDKEDKIQFPVLERKEDSTNVAIGDQLEGEQKQQVMNMLKNYDDVFSDMPGSTNLVEHCIEVVNDNPVRSKPYPIPYALRETLRKEVQQMVDLGIVRASSSPYSSPVVMVGKKDGTHRVTIDYRKLNKITVFDSEPTVKPEDIFAKIQSAKFYSKFDMTKGYWQIPMKKEDIPKTSFVTPDGCWEFLKMPFGAVNSAATYIKMMRKLTEGMKNIDHYIDDCLIYTDTWEEHLQVLEDFLSRVRAAGLTIKPSKSAVGCEKIDFLGHEVGDQVITLQEENVEKIVRAERPKTKKQVKSFLGLTGYYRNFIPNYTAIAVPLIDLTRKKAPNQVEWSEPQEKAFQELKRRLIAKPILRLPDVKEPFVLRTDASNEAIGAVLLQEHEEGIFPVGYASRRLLPREQNYSVMEKECLAIVWAVHRFQIYLYGRQFTLQTDHQPLTYMSQKKFVNDRIMRWAMALQAYRIRVEAIKGSHNIGADYLSRI